MIPCVHCVLNDAGHFMRCVVYFAGDFQVIMIICGAVLLLLLLLVIIVIFIYKRKGVHYQTAEHETHTCILYTQNHIHVLLYPVKM